MTLTIVASLNGVPVPLVLDDDAVAALVAALPLRDTAPPSPYMTIAEAAAYLRCKRHRVDDLLSQGRLERVKDGSRTLIRRRDIDVYLGGALR